MYEYNVCGKNNASGLECASSVVFRVYARGCYGNVNSRKFVGAHEVENACARDVCQRIIWVRGSTNAYFSSQNRGQLLLSGISFFVVFEVFNKRAEGGWNWESARRPRRLVFSFSLKEIADALAKDYVNDCECTISYTTRSVYLLFRCILK